MNLYINYYNAAKRQHEIDYCLEKNLANPTIKKVVIFNEKEEVKHKKAVNIMTDKRPTYQDFFNQFEEDKINIVANSDIFFDETLQKAKDIQPNMCYAITRWEFDGVYSHRFEEKHIGNCPAHFSQDVWIIKGKSKLQGVDTVIAARNHSRYFDTIRFTIGIPGTDNVIAALLKNKYTVKNPAYEIKCHHYHKDVSRRRYTHRITGARSQWGIIRNGMVPISGL